MSTVFDAISRFISFIVDSISEFYSLAQNGPSFVRSFLGFLPGPLVTLLVASLAVSLALAVLKLL